MDKTTSCVVYWLFDGRCVCPWHHGYIGISICFEHRLAAHRRGLWKGARWRPREFNIQILFSGTRNECRSLEFKMRPHFDIGWNRNPGGGRTDGERISQGLKKNGFKITWGNKIAKTLTGHVRTLESRLKQSASFKGTTKPPEQREKMHQAGLDRYADRKPRSESQERERLAKNARRAARRAAGLPRLY